MNENRLLLISRRQTRCCVRYKANVSNISNDIVNVIGKSLFNLFL